MIYNCRIHYYMYIYIFIYIYKILNIINYVFNKLDSVKH